MDIKGSIDNGIITVVMNGRLDMQNAMQAEQHFLKYAESGKDFVLDFSGVDFIASAGVRALLTLYRSVEDRKGSVTIKSPQPQVLEVLQETEFSKLFIISR